MTIADVYEQFKIMPNLARHMYQVAAVGAIIADAFGLPDRDDVVRACLLHDMGNIIKFDLKYFPDTLQPEGYDYWNSVKNDYLEKYGSDEHQATLAIAQELRVSDRVLELIDSIGFSKACENLAHNDFSKKVCDYADMRVAPYGIVSMAERLEEGRKRYEGRVNKQLTEEGSVCFQKLEQQIFSQVSLKPEEINEKSAKPYLTNLGNFKI